MHLLLHGLLLHWLLHVLLLHRLHGRLLHERLLHLLHGLLLHLHVVCVGVDLSTNRCQLVLIATLLARLKHSHRGLLHHLLVGVHHRLAGNDLLALTAYMHVLHLIDLVVPFLRLSADIVHAATHAEEDREHELNDKDDKKDPEAVVDEVKLVDAELELILDWLSVELRLGISTLVDDRHRVDSVHVIVEVVPV